jgi:hypothetical protein
MGCLVCAVKADSDTIKKLIKEQLADPATSGEKWYFRIGDGEGGETMLLAHQAPRLGELLRKYGGSALFMEATYKTTMWDIPTLINSVVSNHGRGYRRPFSLWNTRQQTPSPKRCVCESILLVFSYA